MMMVVTVMAVALHLIQKLREDPQSCQIQHCQPTRLTLQSAGFLTHSPLLASAPPAMGVPASAIDR